MALSDTFCRQVKHSGRPAGDKHTDGQGLYLHVTAAGKYWRVAYRFVGKQKTLALGVYPAVSLAQARKKRDEARELLAQDIDPSQAKRTGKLALQTATANTFESVARDWWAHWSAAKTVRHSDYVLRRLEADVFPEIGTRPIENITAPELVKMAKKIADRGALDIAKRMMQGCGQVFRYAIAHGRASRNPATEIRPSDILPSRKKVNYARLDAKELPELLRHIEAYEGTPYTRLGMKLMALTFVRTSELIGAQWAEFDLDTAEWRIPAERMKMRTPHIVPLSSQAVEVLRSLHLISGHRRLVFPGERDYDKPMSNNTILKALERMGYKGRMTGHGFRGIASTILHEQGYPHHIIEIQLAHQERDEVSAAYNHATYLAERRKMMNEWANYLDRLRRGADVIQMVA